MADSNLSGPLNITDALIVGGTAHFVGAVTFDGGQNVTGDAVASGNVTATGGTIVVGTNKISFGTTTPLAGTRGDVVLNTLAAAGGGTVGWQCVAAGATATWKAFGSIAA